MPRPGELEHFRGRHHLVVVLLVVVVCAVVLARLGQGWRPAGEGESAVPIGLRISPNTASVQELTAIPGVGPKLAERIVTYRERQRVAGREPVFAELGDLDAVEGIGEATLDAIGPYLRFDATKP